MRGRLSDGPHATRPEPPRASMDEHGDPTRRTASRRTGHRAEPLLGDAASVTWTLYHPGRQPRPGPQSANRDKGKNAATSRRSDAAQRGSGTSRPRSASGSLTFFTGGSSRTRCNHPRCCHPHAPSPQSSRPVTTTIKWCSHAAAAGADGDRRPLEASGAVVASRQRFALDVVRNAFCSSTGHRLPPFLLPHHLPTAENNRRGLRVRNKLLTAHAGSCLACPSCD